MSNEDDRFADWFPVRITSVLAGGRYSFVEVWALPGGSVADKIGGRVNFVDPVTFAGDPAYAIDGATFTATAAGSAVQVLARRAVGAGGVQWELKGFGGTSIYGRFGTDIGFAGPLSAGEPITGLSAGYYLAIFSGNALVNASSGRFAISVYPDGGNPLLVNMVGGAVIGVSGILEVPVSSQTLIQVPSNGYTVEARYVVDGGTSLSISGTLLLIPVAPAS